MWTSNSQLMNRVLSAGLCWLSDTFQGFSTDGKNANLLQKFQSFLLTVPTVWFSCYTIYLFEPSRAYIFPFAPMQPRAVEPGLKQDWNLKLNLERQTRGRRQTDKSARFSTGIYRRNYLLPGAHWHRMSSAANLPWLGFASRDFALLEYTLSVKVLLTLCYILRSINCSRSWLVWSVWRFSTNVEWNLGSKEKA
jgi:hypothetical protein